MDIAALELLGAAWNERYAARAAGGRGALSGFRFQLAVCLHESVRAWLQAPDAPPSTFVEVLSDLVDIADNLVVAQIKLRESPAAARAALDELWLIWRLAADVIPAERDRLEFRILYRHAGTAAAREVVSSWTRPDADPGELAEFRGRVRIEVFEDPVGDLLGLLSNELQAPEPARLVRQWLGRLIDGLDERTAWVNSARDIWSDLVTLRRAQVTSPGFHIVTRDDRAPDTLARGGFLTGQQPRLWHLTAGYFASRPALTERFLDAFDEWTETDVEHDGPTALPVFWITGRSGSGKSVMLLQLMTALHERHQGPIVWLRSGAWALPQTVTWLRAQNDDLSGRPILVIDDPWAPGRGDAAAAAWRDAFAHVDDLIGRDQAHLVPVLLCCGPTEQAAQMSRDLSDNIALRRVELPFEGADDLRWLRDWYVQRTGEHPPETGDDNVLLVQLFFEWTVGEGLEAFGRRFLTRVDASDQTGAVRSALSRMLALNRLYVDYPAPALDFALTPVQRELLARLRGEHHLGADESSDGTIRLAHPHLANALFNSWYPPADAPVQREQLLEEALLAAYEHAGGPAQRVAPLLAVARELENERAGADSRADPGTRGLLQRIYPQFQDGLRSEDSELRARTLAAWVQTRLLGHTDLAPDPIELAMQFLAEPDASVPGAGFVVTALLRGIDAVPEPLCAQVIDLIIAFLDTQLDAPLTAVHLSLALGTKHKGAFQPVVARWLRAEDPQNLAGRVALAAVESPTDAVVEALIPAFPHVSPSPAWVRVAVALLADDRFPDAVIHAWVARHRGEQTMGKALFLLVEAGFPSAEQWAHEWVTRYGAIAHDTRTLEALLARRGLQSELVAIALRRLRHPDGDASFLAQLLIDSGCSAEVHEAVLDTTMRRLVTEPTWLHVWYRLYERSPTAELRDVALELLAKLDYGDPAWTYLFERLVQAGPGAELERLGRQWLGAQPFDDPSWPFMWQEVYKPGDTEGAEVGLRWLQVNPGHASWGYVWDGLVAGGMTAELAALGTGVVVGDLEHASWPRIWSDLVVSGHAATLGGIGLEWLRRTDPEHRAFLIVLTAALERVPTDQLDAFVRDLLGRKIAYARLRAIVNAILVNRPGTLLQPACTTLLPTLPVGSSLFLDLWDATESQALRDLAAKRAMRWLITSTPDSIQWFAIWKRAWDHGPNPALDHVTDRWLQQSSRSLDHVFVAVIARALSRKEQRASARRIGLQALTDANDFSEGWAWLWKLLWNDAQDDALHALADRFLEGAVADPSWPLIWHLTHRFDTHRDRALELADRWLESRNGQRDRRGVRTIVEASRRAGTTLGTSAD